MKLRKLLVSSLFLAIGLMLHEITPPIFMGMKPDFLLSMMFIAILFSYDYKTTLIIGIASGILTAATTGFPGGQLPNIIDKAVTCNFVYLLIKLIGSRLQDGIKIVIISILGTFVSGSVFLLSALLITGLPAAIFTMILSVVLPASILNTVFTIAAFNAVSTALRRVAHDKFPQ